MLDSFSLLLIHLVITQVSVKWIRDSISLRWSRSVPTVTFHLDCPDRAPIFVPITAAAWPLIGQSVCIMASDWSELTTRCVLVDGNQSASWQLGILGKCRHEMTITCHQPIRVRYQVPLTNQRPTSDRIISCDNHRLTEDLVLLSIKPRCDFI